jgi:hypothetical protein
MKLYAHVGVDGNIEGLVAVPEGKVSAELMSSPELQVCEVQNHDIKGKTVDLDKLEKLLATSTVEVTPAQGKLIRRKK